MKALPFNVVKLSSESFKVQIESQDYFYDYFHTHPEIQLTTIISSTGTLIAGNYISSFKEGDTFLLGSDIPHVFRNDEIYYAENSNKTAKAISIFIRPDILTPDFITLPELNLIKQLIQKSQNGIKFDSETANKITTSIKSIAYSKGAKRIISLLEILHLASQSTQYTLLSSDIKLKIGNELDGERFNKILRYTLNKFHTPITLDEISAVANLTRNSFCRYFKKKTRKSYVTFLNELRINHACNLLFNKELHITEVAFQSGFNNLTNFNRIFKNIIGNTPRNYRATFLNNM